MTTSILFDWHTLDVLAELSIRQSRQKRDIWLEEEYCPEEPYPIGPDDLDDDTLHDAEP